MDCSVARKVILFQGLWKVLTYFCVTCLSLCFFKLKITNSKCNHVFASLLFNLQCLFCSVILALNLTSVSNVRFLTLLSTPTSYSMNVLVEEYGINEAIIKDIFIFVISIFVFHAWTVGLSDRFISSEFWHSASLVFFFWSGYYSRFLAITFFVNAVSNLSQVVRKSSQLLVVKKNVSWTINAVQIASLLLSFSFWMYLFAYIVPTYCLVPVLMINSKNVTDQFYFIIFKILFVLYYIAEISNSPLADYIVRYKNRFKQYYRIFMKMIRNQNSMYVNDDELYEQEETLKMYTGQGKSASEIKRQLALMQTVKCVVAIRKKMKRNRENREKLLKGGKNESN